jgi:stage III sporulation protein AD
MLQIVGVALIVAFLILLLKDQKPIFAMMLTIVAGIAIFLSLLQPIETIVAQIKAMAERADVQFAFVGTMMKMIGIAYVTEFTVQSLRDAGLESIAAKVELAGKIFILVLAIPIMQMILDTILKLLEK